MGKEKLTVKTTLPYAEAVSYMENLVDSLKSGTIVVQSDEKYVTLTPGAQVSLEVGAKIKKGKQRFSFEIEWSEEDDVKLTISDTPQEAAVPAEKPDSSLAAREKGEMAEVEPAEVPATKTEAKTPSTTEDAPKKAKKKAASKKDEAKAGKGKKSEKK